MPNPSISEHTDSRNTPQLGFASQMLTHFCAAQDSGRQERKRILSRNVLGDGGRSDQPSVLTRQLSVDDVRHLFGMF